MGHLFIGISGTVLASIAALLTAAAVLGGAGVWFAGQAATSRSAGVVRGRTMIATERYCVTAAALGFTAVLAAVTLALTA